MALGAHRSLPQSGLRAEMPLVGSFWLSKKKGKKAWVEPVVEGKRVRFEIRSGNPDEATSTLIDAGSGFVNDRGKKVKATFRCVVCGGGVAKGEYIDEEANNGRMGSMPLIIVAESGRGRSYLPFDEAQENVALLESKQYLDNSSLHEKVPTEPAQGTFASNAQGRIYVFKTFADYFTSRQLVALTTFNDLVREARERVQQEALATGLSDDGALLNDGGTGAQAYVDAVSTYLAMALSRLSDISNSPYART